MKTFKQLVSEARPQDYVPAQYQDDEEEATGYKPRSKGEEQFKDAHVTAKKDHPVAQDNQFKGTTDHSGDHEGHDGEPGEREPVKQGTSTLSQFMNKISNKQTPTRKGDKRQGDMKPVMAKEETDLTEREDTAMQVARALKKMGVKSNTREAEILKKIPDVLKKMGLGNNRLIKRDPDFQGDVIDSLRSMKEETDLTEGVVDTLKKISDRKQTMPVKFKNGKTIPVDPKSASAILKVHNQLNTANAKKMRDSLEKGEQSFMKMLDFAMM
jgi:hypothetical protein